MRWSVVVPVKRLTLAKSRLDLPAADRADLALAMACDVVATALSCPLVGQVLVISDDARARDAVHALGAVLVDDEPDAGLNPALSHGVSTARRAAPDDAVAIVSSDVPGMTVEELSLVLTAAAALQRGYLGDAAGTGTTVLTALPGVVVEPGYGPASGATHRRLGYVRIEVAADGLSHDVDSLEDLRAVLLRAPASAAPLTKRVAALAGLTD